MEPVIALVIIAVVLTIVLVIRIRLQPKVGIPEINAVTNVNGGLDFLEGPGGYRLTELIGSGKVQAGHLHWNDTSDTWDLEVVDQDGLKHQYHGATADDAIDKARLGSGLS